MFLDVERYVSFLAKSKLSQQQFLFLYLIKRKKHEIIKMYKEAFPTEDGSMIGNDAKNDLIERGFIKHVGEGSKPSDYEITDKFNNLYISNIHNAADEVWAAYPGFTNIEGRNAPLTNVDRYQFALLYGERIDYSVEEHNEVMKDVIYGREKSLIKSNIENFVKAQSWEKIREIRLSQTKVTKQSEDSF